MQRLVAGLFITFVVLASTAVFEAIPAGACSCGSMSDADALARSDAVFVGEVTGYEAPPTADGFSSADPARWTFAVSRVYKGDVAATQTVVSEFSGASCGLEIPKTGEFIVFAETRGSVMGPEPERGELYAGLCGGTRSVTAGLLDPTLASSEAPHPATSVGTDDVEDGSGGWPIVPIVGAAVVAVVIGLGFARRARSRAVE